MKDAIALCYHAVSEHWPATLSVNPHDLDQQLAHLLRRGYRPVTFTELVLAGGRGRRMAITFDDAFASVLDLAFGVLAGHGVPATVFVPTHFAGASRLSWPEIEHWSSGSYAHELRPLTWPELRRLSDAGWEIGSHTRTHRRLTRLPPAELDEELRGSLEDCETGIGRSCRAIAYPYGDVDDRVLAAAARAGYTAGAALSDRWRRPQRLEWPRVGIGSEDAMPRFLRQTSPAVRRLRRSGAYAAVERVYGVARRATHRPRG